MSSTPRGAASEGQLVAAVRQSVPEARVLAVGTNTAATAAMLKAGAHQAATGENAVAVACRQADVIVGPIGIVIADSMLGEVTPAMALAVARSRAKRILIPFDHCDSTVVGVADPSPSALLREAVEEIKRTAR